MTEKRKPGPKPEVFKVPLSFEEAVKAALETKPPPDTARRNAKKKPKGA